MTTSASFASIVLFLTLLAPISSSVTMNVYCRLWDPVNELMLPLEMYYCFDLVGCGSRRNTWFNVFRWATEPPRPQLGLRVMNPLHYELDLWGFGIENVHKICVDRNLDWVDDDGNLIQKNCAVLDDHINLTSLTVPGGFSQSSWDKEVNVGAFNSMDMAGNISLVGDVNFLGEIRTISCRASYNTVQNPFVMDINFYKMRVEKRKHKLEKKQQEKDFLSGKNNDFMDIDVSDEELLNYGKGPSRLKDFI